MQNAPAIQRSCMIGSNSTNHPMAQTSSFRLVLGAVILTSIVWMLLFMFFVKFPNHTNTIVQPPQPPRYVPPAKQQVKQVVPPPKPKVIDIEQLDETTPISKEEVELFRENMEQMKTRNPNLNPNVDIKPSAIPGGGMGLFAARDISAKERILWAIGDWKTYEEIEEHYAQKGQTFRELSTLNGRFYIIPRTEDKWGYINHKYGAPNTQFKEEYFNFKKMGDTPYRIHEAAQGSQTISISALIPIKKGQELFIDYGPDYNYEAAGFNRKETA